MKQPLSNHSPSLNQPFTIIESAIKQLLTIIESTANITQQLSQLFTCQVQLFISDRSEVFENADYVCQVRRAAVRCSENAYARRRGATLADRCNGGRLLVEGLRSHAFASASSVGLVWVPFGWPNSCRESLILTRNKDPTWRFKSHLYVSWTQGNIALKNRVQGNHQRYGCWWLSRIKNAQW